MEVEVHVKTESPRVAHMRPDGYTLGIGLAGALPPCRTWWQGQTDLGILDPTTSLATVRAGLVKAFTVTAATHPASAADIPTVDEVGLPSLPQRQGNFSRDLAPQQVDRSARSAR
jgi:tripartite-type tricarboxylate transporter receptor subunit TctC